MSNEEVALTDEEILAIAGTVVSAPVTPWQLKDEVVVGDIRRQVLSFARAVIEAQEVKSNHSFVQKVIECEFNPDSPEYY